MLDLHFEPKSEERITTISLTPTFVPFREEVLQTMRMGPNELGMALAADEPWTGGDFVICKMETDKGTIGWGECFLWLPETGYTANQVIDVIQAALAKYVIGKNPYDILAINEAMRRNVMKNDLARGLLDMVLYDLVGRIEGRSVSDLLGGAQMSHVPLCGLVPLASPEFMATFAQAFVGMGHKSMRVKLGEGAQKDRAIIQAIREAIGTEIRLRVDYNQAYTPDEAIIALETIAEFGIDVAEQPVAAEDYLGMAKVQKAVRIPLMAHEGCFSLGEMRLLADLDGMRVMGINNERPGGMTGALQAMDLAKERGMGIVLHNQPLGICSAMLAHLAASRYSDLKHEPELFGHIMLSDDLLETPLVYENGGVRLPTGPGWGVAFHEEKIATYAVGATVTISNRE